MSESYDEQALAKLRSMAATLCVDLNAYGMRELVQHVAYEIGGAMAKVAELKAELDRWPLHGEGRLTKSGWSLAQDRYRHVCETVEEFRGYWTELQDSKARVGRLEAEAVKMVEELGSRRLPSLDETEVASLEADVDDLEIDHRSVSEQLNVERHRAKRNMDFAKKAATECDDANARVAVLEAGVRELYRLHHLRDAANEDPKRYGGYQGSTLYMESFEDLVVQLVGEQPDPTEESADQSNEEENDG